ncbi:beta-galactosidase [Kitasatospora sp. NPDC058170]|uniref:beta-galactosidase n=1 Tax=Kitasatospora sp. NPDC058170 TaxID=3346364 RepID=UPI0036DD61F8
MSGERSGPGGARPAFEDGTLRLDGRPRFLITGEYPYYRDHHGRWAAKLGAMSEAGIEVVTCYVPWRHHEVTRNGGRSWCFDRDGNRDLAAFLGLVAAAGLLALPKPGPFVHAELPFGGLPDRVSPTLDPARHAARAADGRPLPYQQFTLPSALDPRFLEDATEWLRAVGRFLRPFVHPRGPVIAVQIGNEGHYGETALPIDALDYSPPAVDAFARFAPGVKPPGVRPPGADPPGGGLPGAGAVDPAGDPPSPAGLRALIRWGEWSAEVLAAGMAGLAEALGPGVPVLTTYAPPARADRVPGRAAGRYDAWLARNRVGAPPALPRAYTSWTGDVLADDEALVNYVLAAKGGRGPNIEENWGLRWADPGCAFPVVPIHHTLLGVACGATGISVYPACATAGWGEQLAVDRTWPAGTAGDPAPFEPPYGDAAPILVDAGPGPAFAAVRVLTHFLTGQQEVLAVSRPEPGVRWGVHPAYAAVGAWSREAGRHRDGEGDGDGEREREQEQEQEQEQPVPSADRTLLPFVTHCLRRNLPFHLEELSGRTVLDPAAGPLVAVSGRFMERAVQQRLASFAERGGPLLVLGGLPRLDEDLRPCTELADAVRRCATAPGGPARVRAVSLDARPVGTAVDEWLGASGTAPSRSRPGAWLELRRTVADPEDVLVFLFNRSGGPLHARTTCGEHVVAVDLVGSGCAVLRVSHGRLRACYVKGLNERTGAGVPVRVRVGGDLLHTDRPCDLSAVRRPGGYDLRTAGSRGAAHVFLPEGP